jgi:hypothetical protein
MINRMDIRTYLTDYGHHAVVTLRSEVAEAFEKWIVAGNAAAAASTNAGADATPGEKTEEEPDLLELMECPVVPCAYISGRHWIYQGCHHRQMEKVARKLRLRDCLALHERPKQHAQTD